MLKKITLIISILSFSAAYLHATRIVTYWNHDTIPYNVSLHEITEDGVEDIFDLIKLKAGKIVNCGYDEPLSNITKMVVIDNDGERRVFNKPFFFMLAPNCTVNIYRKKIEIGTTFGRFQMSKEITPKNLS